MAAAASASNKFTCVMLLEVHGTVSLDVDQVQPRPSMLRPLALEEIGKHIWRHDDRGSGSGSVTRDTKPAKVVCLVSPSNMGYSIMNRGTLPFDNRLQAFIKEIKSNPDMDENEISQFFYSYESILYSFFREGLSQQLRDIESQMIAEAKEAKEEKEEDHDTRKFMLKHPDIMRSVDFYHQMQATRDALGLHWLPHAYCIDNKKYCPGKNANQCCLYFPDIDHTLHERLRLRLMDITKKTHSQSSTQPKLLSYLDLQFNSESKCVLTITFNYDTTGVIKNKLWKDISLDRFVGQVKSLLDEFFSGVFGFDVSHSMSRTCLVDAACSDFSVPRNEVSIIGFERGSVDKQHVSGLIAVGPQLESHVGFWEYWINHNPADAAAADAAARAGAMVHKRPVYHSVVIPRELEDFVPACLTCSGSTIRKVEPVFDDEGNVIRVDYTYLNGVTEERDYVARVPELPTQSMEPSMAAQPSSSPAVLYSNRVDYVAGQVAHGVSVPRPNELQTPGRSLKVQTTFPARTYDIQFGGRRRIHKSSVQRRKHHHSNKKGKTVRRKMTRTRRSSRRSSRR